MIRKIKRYVTIIVVVCIISCMALAVPIFSNADSIEPTASIEISKVDKELTEQDVETAAVKSDANISTDMLDKALTTTNVVSLNTSNALISYLIKYTKLLNRNKVGEYKTLEPAKVDNSNSKYLSFIILEKRQLISS